MMLLSHIARTRRNPASQTIVLRLAQCSSKARSDASLGILMMSQFPEKSGKSATFAPRRRLTGGLPDVGTDGVLHRSLIRWLRSSHPGARAGPGTAFTVP